MSQLRPFRQYDEHDVINLFTYDLTGITSTAGVLHAEGKLVKIATGWKADDDQVDLGGDVGTVPNNVLSESWSLTAKVVESGATEFPIGLALVGMRDEDENGEKLIYNPRKAAEMGVVVPGQSVPILTRGLVIYKGSSTDWTNGTPAAGGTAYAGADGEINVTQGSNNPVGTFLGGKDANGFVLIKIEL